MKITNDFVQETFERYIMNKRKLRTVSGLEENYLLGRIRENEILFDALGIDHSYERTNPMIEGEVAAKVFDQEPEEPWHTEEWYEDDLGEALEEAHIEPTERNVQLAKELCKGIFDDLSGRRETLIYEIENAGIKWEHKPYTVNDFMRIKQIDKATGSWSKYGSFYDINYSSILSYLIKAAGRCCERFSSDLFVDWEGINKNLVDIDYDGGRYLFGFRKDGVDHAEFVLSRANNNDLKEYKELYLLEVYVEKEYDSEGKILGYPDITMILSEAGLKGE